MASRWSVQPWRKTSGNSYIGISCCERKVQAGRRNDSARASSGTCPGCRKGMPGPTETRRAARSFTCLFSCSCCGHHSWTPFFLVVGAVQCDVARNAGLTGVLGMPLAFVQSTSFAAVIPFRVDAILLAFKPFFATIWSGLAWMWADLQMSLPLPEPFVSTASCALGIMMANAALACHFSWSLLPNRVLGRNQSTL